MPKLKRLSASEIVSTFQHFGFSVLTQRGSHIKLGRISQAGEKQTLVVPNHREFEERRAQRGDWRKFDAAMAKVPNVPPLAGDELAGVGAANRH
jgi:predicted RNA binding protein YcfA (HicA-like mRNA interferase family)